MGWWSRVTNYFASKSESYKKLENVNARLEDSLGELESQLSCVRDEKKEVQQAYEKISWRYEIIKGRAKEWLSQRDEAVHQLGVNVKASEFFVRNAKTAERRYSELEDYVLGVFAHHVSSSRGGRVLLDSVPEVVAVSPAVASAFGYGNKDFSRAISLKSRKALDAIESDQIADDVEVNLEEGTGIVDGLGVYPVSYKSGDEVVSIGTVVEFDVKTLRRLKRKAGSENKDLPTLLTVHYLIERAKKLLPGEPETEGV